MKGILSLHSRCDQILFLRLIILECLSFFLIKDSSSNYIRIEKSVSAGIVSLVSAHKKCDNQRKKNECDKEERGRQKQNGRISVTISSNPKVGSFSSLNTSSSFDQLETFVNI